VEWQYFKTTIEATDALKKEGYKLIAIEQTENAIMLNEFDVKQNLPCALIFGNEVKGVSQEVIDICDSSIEIPQEGTKHSLNVSVSIGVVLWEFCR
jgi:tRNA G18 (ribose-2'-O)-methylase SpoU